MKNSLCLKESSNKDKVSSVFTEVQGWFCNPVNLLLALKETSFNVSETTEQVKKREKKTHMHLVQLKTGNEAEYMEAFYICFLDQVQVCLLCFRFFFPH